MSASRAITALGAAICAALLVLVSVFVVLPAAHADQSAGTVSAQVEPGNFSGSYTLTPPRPASYQLLANIDSEEYVLAELGYRDAGEFIEGSFTEENFVNVLPVDCGVEVNVYIVDDTYDQMSNAAPYFACTDSPDPDPGTTCKDLGYDQNYENSPVTGEWGTASWQGANLTVAVNNGSTVMVCVKGGSELPITEREFSVNGSYTHPQDISHIGIKYSYEEPTPDPGPQPDPDVETRTVEGDPDCETRTVEIMHQERTRPYVLNDDGTEWVPGDWSEWVTTSTETREATEEECPYEGTGYHGYDSVAFCVPVELEGQVVNYMADYRDAAGFYRASADNVNVALSVDGSTRWETIVNGALEFTAPASSEVTVSGIKAQSEKFEGALIHGDWSGSDLVEGECADPEPPVEPEPVKVKVPAAPESVDPCNPEGVDNNVAWAGDLPEDTDQIDWSESADGTTRTASLKGDNVEWADGTTADKVFELPADSGDTCPVEPEPTPPSADEFFVMGFWPDCDFGDYYVYLEYSGQAYVELQQQNGEAWVSVDSASMSNDEQPWAELSSGELTPGEEVTFRVIAKNTEDETAFTVVYGPETVVRPTAEACEELVLPEEEWTVAESGCGFVRFTNMAEEEVTVMYGSYEENEPDGTATIATSESVVVETERVQLDWFSYITETGAHAGDGSVEVEQDCDPGTPPVDPQPEPPVEPTPDPGPVDPPRTWTPPVHPEPAPPAKEEPNKVVSPADDTPTKDKSSDDKHNDAKKEVARKGEAYDTGIESAASGISPLAAIAVALIFGLSMLLRRQRS